MSSSHKYLMLLNVSCHLYLSLGCHMFMQARFKPIISMLEDIYTSVMYRVGTKHDLSENLDRQICPRIMRKLQKLKDNSRFWQARVAGNGKYSVFMGLRAILLA